MVIESKASSNSSFAIKSIDVIKKYNLPKFNDKEEHKGGYKGTISTAVNKVGI